MSDDLISPPTTSNSIAPVLSYIDNKTRVKFDESCLKHDKFTFAHVKAVNICICL